MLLTFFGPKQIFASMDYDSSIKINSPILHTHHERERTMSTSMVNKPLAQLSLADLTASSAQEIRKYRRNEPSDDSYCLEILRRAVVLRNNEAWIVLSQLFGEHVHMWLARHSHREAALRYEVEQNYVDDAFRRFWQAAADQKLKFNNLGEALCYLRLCLHCAIMDTLRAYVRPNLERMPDYGHPNEPQVEDRYHEDELWETISNVLLGKRERRVAYLHFHCNLKPREIVRYCSDEFRDKEEVYRLKRTIMERIVRNADKIRWQLADSTC
jgi:hypothetical protein